MLFIFSTPVSIKHLRQLKTVIFLHWCLLRAVPFERKIIYSIGPRNVIVHIKTRNAICQ